MKKESGCVLRITVDEKIGTDLVRFVICPLKRDIEIFTDLDEQWEEEDQKLVPAKEYQKALQEWGIGDPSDLPWDRSIGKSIKSTCQASLRSSARYIAAT